MIRPSRARPPCELLTTAQMSQADRLAVAAGISSLELMEAAGKAVADAALAMAGPGDRFVVLCGPGNNGGDGFAAARLLRQRGLEVSVACLVTRDRLGGDAARMAALWSGPITALDAAAPGPDCVMIDALFGAGLNRRLDPAVEQVLARGVAAQARTLAVDVPSGVDGTTGALHGDVPPADRTVTFFRLKPGHLLMPGRGRCGMTILADIGIPEQVLDDIAPTLFANRPELWQAHLPRLREEMHKYDRGHAVAVSGPRHATGAARLGARAALRIGAGLVTVASPADAVDVNAAQLTAIMVRPFDGKDGLTPLLADRRLSAWLIGPAAGVGPETRQHVAAILASPAAAVLDADALTSFAAGMQTELLGQIRGRGAPVVLTPHAGEFSRLFGAGAGTGAKTEMARAAAAAGGAIVVLKGPDTIIAHPDGRAAINDNAPPTLATAGSGDVLAGMILGLLAQRMPPWEAACAAVWLHGEAARNFGPGLIAEDLPELLPKVLRRLAE